MGDQLPKLLILASNRDETGWIGVVKGGKDLLKVGTSWHFLTSVDSGSIPMGAWLYGDPVEIDLIQNTPKSVILIEDQLCFGELLSLMVQNA